MADETVKKPAVVVHKKSAVARPQAATTPASNAAKPASPAANNTAEAPKKKVVVVKKKSAAPEKKPVASAETEKTDKPVAEKPANEKQTAQAAEQPKPQERKSAGDQRQVQQGGQKTFRRSGSFEINSSRPNVKAGNLSDHTQRQPYGNRDGRPNGGFQRREGSGFTGAQARQS